MKKWLCVLTAAVFCFGILTSCSSTEEKVNLSMAGSNQNVQVTSQLHEKEYKSVDGKLLLGKSSYNIPFMSGPADDASSAAVVASFNDGVEKMLTEESEYWDVVMEEGQSYYDSYGSDIWSYGGYWSSELDYTANQTEKLVSVLYEHYVFSGGVHGYTYYTSQLFDLEKGCFITLKDMTDDAEALSETVTDEILRQIEENDLAVQYGYWPEYADCVAGWMDGYSTYFREEGGLQIIFPAYDLAAYAAGPQTFVVAQEVYEPYLNDDGKELLEIQ